MTEISKSYPIAYLGDLGCPFCDGDSTPSTASSCQDTINKIASGVAGGFSNINWWWIGGAVVAGFLIGHHRKNK